MLFHSSAARKNRLNACLKISACSWRLTKIDSSAVKTSPRLPMSITCSAFMASITEPGPTGSPAARSARAKPTTLSAMLPVGGLRWSMAVGICALTNDSVLAGRFLQNFLQTVALHTRDIVLILQQCAESVADHLRGQRARIELGERRGPVDGLGDAGRLVEILVAQRLHETHDLLRQLCRDAGHAALDDRKLAFGRGIIDPVIK